MKYDPGQVYRPEADTWLLMEAVRNEIRPGDRVLEVGTGSGIIAESVSRVTTVIAVDISPHAAAAARARGIEVLRMDLAEGVRGPFDLVIFNPPYLPTRPEERLDDWLERALDGGENGRDVIARFADRIGRVLAPGGRILLLISSLTGLQEVESLFAKAGFAVTIAAQERAGDEMLSVLRISRDADGITGAAGDPRHRHS